MAKGNDRCWINVFHVYEVLISRVGIAIDAAFAGFTFAVPIPTIFKRKYVSGRVVEKFVDGGAVGDVSSVSMKGQEGEFRFFIGNPPGVEVPSVEVSQMS